MLQGIDTARIAAGLHEPAHPRLTRRAALAGLGGSALVACAPADRPAAAGSRRSLDLDFTQPEDNLTAWVKLISSLEGGTETCGFFTGIQYADLHPQEVIQPLFRIAGFGMSRVSRLPDGRYQNLHREVVYYMDLKEDRILDEWRNPYTGETVEVFHTHNDPVNSHYAPVFRQRFGSEQDGFRTVEFPFVLPWTIVGDRAVVSFSVNTRWPTPLPPAKWPREHFGEFYRTSEYFQIHASLADINDPDMPKVPHTGSWQKVAPWHPWMLMDNRPGGIFGITSTFSLKGVEELPPIVRAYTEKHYPKYLNAPTEWVEPNMTTWETYSKERTPAPAKSPAP